MNQDRLYDIMRAIESLSRERGFPPTVREIGKAVGVSSPATVHQAIDILKRRGWAVSDQRIPRSLRLTETGKEWFSEQGS